MAEAARRIDLFARPAAEDWLAYRLEQLGHVLEPGAGPLKDRLRHVITTHGIGCIIAGRAPNGRPENFAEAWERVYGEALIPKSPRNSRSPQPKAFRP